MSPLFVTSCSCTIICTLFATSFGSPITLDLFPGFARNNDLTLPIKEGQVVKRRVFNDNSDAAGLKQISLQSLIGDLESSFLQSAHSVSSLAHDKDAVVAEVTPPTVVDHAITKRHTEEKFESSASESTTEPLPDVRKIVLQTTEKVPERLGVPAHILIDHISVQPHTGGVPLIPAFQVHHTKVVQTTVTEKGSKDGDPKSTQITITKTDIKATGVSAEKLVAIEKPEIKTTEEPDSAAKTSAVAEDTSNISFATSTSTEASKSSSSTTTTSTTSTTTTPPTHKELKEAEQELKEKVAEIEAEPVILSARV